MIMILISIIAEVGAIIIVIMLLLLLLWLLKPLDHTYIDTSNNRLNTLRLIGPISYPGECDLMVHGRKYSVIFSRMYFVTFVYVNNMHQDTKSA